MSTTTYAVTGMTCGGCAGRVEQAASTVAGVESARADVAAGTLTVTGRVDEQGLRAAVDAAGYRLS